MKQSRLCRLVLCGMTALFVLNLKAIANPPFVFRDVAESTGLLPAAKGIQGHGAGWGDVNGDGWADLYIGTFHYENTQPNLLLLNDKGHFTLADEPQVRISTRATGVVFADLDNDGDLDLYVGSMPADSDSKLAQKNGHAFAGCSLFRNEGQGALTNISKGNGACPLAFGGRSATVLDYNGDGLLDLLVGEDPIPGYNGSPTKSSRLFRNQGGLNFEDVSREAGLPEAAGLGVAAADVNADGWPDIFLASTSGNALFLNDGQGHFQEAKGIKEVFAWPTAKGDDMVCGVTIADVNSDALPDIVLGQHYSSPWLKGVANRLYLHRGFENGNPRFEDVTERVGLVPLPMKAPHVEIQDFNNDGKPDISTSIVKFQGNQPHPVIFQNLGNQENALPRFQEYALAVNDFPTTADKAIKRSGTLFEKMIAERKILYSAPGPTCDFDRDGRLDILIANWWAEAPSLLLKNETPSGNWLEVQLECGPGVNRMGIGSKVEVYPVDKTTDLESRLAVREIATGFGYASSQEAIAHFGLGNIKSVDIVVTLPHGKGTLTQKAVKANQRITLKQ